jgi:hypothetical protein
VLGGCQPRVEEKLRKENRQQYRNIWAMNMFKIECCGSYGQLPTERKKQKFVDF